MATQGMNGNGMVKGVLALMRENTRKACTEVRAPTARATAELAVVRFVLLPKMPLVVLSTKRGMTRTRFCLRGAH